MATYQGQALLNYPDSFGQFYQSTPSIPPMKTALGWETDYSSPSSTPRPNLPENYYNYHNSLYESSTEHRDHDDEDEAEFEDYYYDAEQLVTASPDNGNPQVYKQHYEGDYGDVIRVKDRRPPQDKVYNPKVGKADPDDYTGQNDLDNRIRNIRKNDDIFRQGGGDLSTFASYALSAMKVLSLVLSVVDGSGGSGPSNTERIDVGPPTPPTSEIDVALGTLMAFGGKYLRSIAMYAWEHATQTPAEPFGAVASPAAAAPPATVQIPAAPAQEAVVVEAQQPQEVQQPQSVIPTGVPYLSTLPAQQLEDLGLKAVAAGAEPLKLQQAFAAAQLNGDWSQLELEMASVLGPEAVGLNANSGGVAPANNVIPQMQDYGSGPGSVSTSSVSVASPVPVSTSTSSVAPSGLGYYMAVANNYADRLTKVINGPDPSASNTNNLSEDDQIAQQSIVTRFIKEFELEQEALALQYQANSIIRQVNNFIEGTPSEKVDNFGGNVGDEEVVVGDGANGSGGGSSGGIGQFLSSIPNMVGQAAVSVIRFITPVAPQQIEEKVDGPSGPSGVSYSEVSPTVDLDTVTYAALGAGAIGTVLYGIYAASGTEDNRRTSKYKRSIDDNAHIVAAEKQYSQLPYPLQPRLIRKMSNTQTMSLKRSNVVNSLLSTAIGLGVGGLIFYGTLSEEKLRRQSNHVFESTVQKNEQMLDKSIRKYSEIDLLQ